MRLFLILLLIYLIYRFIRNIMVFTVRPPRTGPLQNPEPSATQPKQSKIINKDEGEYVDYEEMKE